MHTKYFACSFDDGLEQDRRIIEILKEHRMSGLFISTPVCLPPVTHAMPRTASAKYERDILR